ncbi:unnamed protein product [Heligmosomoides polygyrus]|uniref:Actin-related protein 2/3 complex subunit 5 n=1 Tax=Heligmosomoides polygyrus TaxID=6339 RepID=A0A183FQS9_HELPZ|nr:unnamed protein product [Heligmosomoides polygyrus]
MAAVRLVSFSYMYAINENDVYAGEFPPEMDQALLQANKRHEAFVPTPVPVEDRSSQRGAVCSKKSSLVIPLHDIERVLPIYLRAYYKEDGKTKRSLIEYEVKNNETLYEMLAVMLRKLKVMKGSYANTVIEDLAEMGKSMFFVFDMAGRLDPKEVPGDKTLSWVIDLKKAKEREKRLKEEQRRKDREAKEKEREAEEKEKDSGSKEENAK